MTEQLDIREIGEINDVQREDKYNPRILIVKRDNCLGGAYYPDSFGQFWDEITHRKLNNEELIKARLAELAQVYKHKVYIKVPVEECIKETWKNPISVRWLDINRGDDDNLEYRTRLVAQELKRDKREYLSVATQLLAAKRLFFSKAVTEGIGYEPGKLEEGMKIDFIDISRAFFQADAVRKVYVQLPPEDHQEGMCGRLGKSVYGTRDAAQNWSDTYVRLMEKI